MLSGKSGFMDKRELESYCGDLAQVFGIEECVLEDGKARGTRGYLLDNGCGLEMIVLRDKCFAIPKLKFKGVNIGLITKAGICGPWFYQEDGTRGFLRNFEGGFLTTCGLTYMGTPGEENGNKNGLHGVISNTPMEHAGSSIDWRDGAAELNLTGEAREAYLFGPNLVIHKSLKVHTDRNRIELHDAVENKDFHPSPLMLLYHFNYGYPFLDENVQIYTNYDRIAPRDNRSKDSLDRISRFERPSVEAEEVVGIRTMSDKNGKDGVTIVYNPKQGIAVKMQLKVRQLPILNQWKSSCAGDYALGMEPGTGHVGGLANTRRDGMLMTILPGEVKRFDIVIDFLDNEEEINHTIKELDGSVTFPMKMG